MARSESIQYHKNVVAERYDEFRRCMDAVITRFGGKDEQSKLNDARSALKAADELANVLASQDQPPWLTNLRQCLRDYSSNPTPHAGKALLQSFISNAMQAKNHDWKFADADSGIDFDSLYNRLRAENRLSEYFDKLIELLTHIIESGAIDSVKVCTALEEMISTLRANRNGSYVASWGAWRYVTEWCKNYLWEQWSDAPFVGPAVRATRKTIEDGRAAMEEINNQIQYEIVQHSIAHQIPDYQDRWPVIEPTKPILLEGPSDPDVSAAEVTK